MTRGQRIEHKLGNAIRALALSRAGCHHKLFSNTTVFAALKAHAEKWRLRYVVLQRRRKDCGPL